jgi:hypothetical protein
VGVEAPDFAAVVDHHEVVKAADRGARAHDHAGPGGAPDVKM